MVTTKQQIGMETITFIALAALVSMFFVWHNNQQSQQSFRVIVPLVTKDNTPAVITPTITPTKVEVASQISPDGTKKVTVKTTTKGTAKNYEISVSDGNGDNAKVIYTDSLSDGQTIVVPFNAFSPDNVYFFIQKNTQQGVDALCFQSSGEAFADGSPYLDILPIFTSRITQYTLNEVTGWASPTLLLANTTTGDGTKGPSFWIEVPSKAVIELATEF